MTKLFNHFEDATSVADPFSEFSEWKADGAVDVRRNWLRMMGLSDAEIEEDCSQFQPTDIDAEVAEYNAMCDIQQLNAKYRST